MSINNLQELWDAWNYHDVYFGFSDDIRVYRRGQKELAEINNAVVQLGPKAQELNEAFLKYHFNKDGGFTGEPGPKPPRP
jgi:hypothetical protein